MTVFRSLTATYDAAAEFQTITCSGAGVSDTCSYDADGHRMDRITNGGGAGTQAFGYDGNALLFSYCRHGFLPPGNKIIN